MFGYASTLKLLWAINFGWKTFFVAANKVKRLYFSYVFYEAIHPISGPLLSFETTKFGHLYNEKRFYVLNLQILNFKNHIAHFLFSWSDVYSVHYGIDTRKLAKWSKNLGCFAPPPPPANLPLFYVMLWFLIVLFNSCCANYLKVSYCEIYVRSSKCFEIVLEFWNWRIDDNFFVLVLRHFHFPYQKTLSFKLCQYVEWMIFVVCWNVKSLFESFLYSLIVSLFPCNS